MRQSAIIPGTLFVISAPSGAGKTSLVKALLDSIDGIVVSISHTTRALRPGEENGVDYHFVDVPGFSKIKNEGNFLEHAQVFDNYYGTSKEAVEKQLNAGVDVILEIDWQGAQQLRQTFPQAVVSIFILPPSRATLRERLTNRGQDGEDIIQRRMQDAATEMSHYGEFDYLLVNDDFATALNQLQTIVQAQRQTEARQALQLKELLEELLA